MLPYGSLSSSLRLSRRWLSSTDLSRLVQGVTQEQIEKDPALAAYIHANFVADRDPAPSTEAPVREAAKGDEEENYPLNIRPLSCYRRDPDWEEGTRNSRKLRYVDIIPGLLYGSDPTLGIYSHQPESKLLVKTPWKYLQSELDRYHNWIESRVYNLTVYRGPDDEEGEVHRVLPRNLQRHPVQSTIYCLNYCRYHAGRPITLPITYANEEESPALKRDGFIVPIQRSIECFIEEGVAIPESLEVECTGLLFKDVIRVDRMMLPDGVRLSDRVRKRGADYILGVVFGKGRGGAAAGEDEEA